MDTNAIAVPDRAVLWYMQILKTAAIVHVHMI